MSKQQPPKILSGFRDYLPEDAILRAKIIQDVRQVFEKFGFSPLETPALEYADVILGKYGNEGEKLLYRFLDHGQRDISLRYDLTVPLARVVAMYPNLPKPFKRYQIAPVWRADKPQQGRFREFYQCDIDIVGSESALSDAECVLIDAEVLKSFGFSDFEIRINNRQLLDDFLSQFKLSGDQLRQIFQSLDKLAKIGQDQVEQEIITVTSAKVSKEIMNFISIKGTNDQILKKLRELFKNKKIQSRGLTNLTEVVGILKKSKIDPKNYQIDLSICRGLDYYTGIVFETIITDHKEIGSVMSGGRYDNLVGMFAGEEIPAVGISLGLDRIFSLIQQNEKEKLLTTTQVLVTVLDEKYMDKYLDISQILRAKKIKTEIYLGQNTSLKKQLKYADKLKISYVIIAGSNEFDQNKVLLKKLKTGDQKTVSIEKIYSEIL